MRALALCALLALVAGCASSPFDDAQPPPPADSAIPPAAPSTSASPSPSDATLTPAQRQARARQAATQADQQAQRALQAQCTQLRSEIREQQLSEQQAPSTSISEPIVQAKQAHADQRIQDLQDQYDSLGCESVVGPQSRTPVAPVSGAPNGLTPP